MIQLCIYNFTFSVSANQEIKTQKVSFYDMEHARQLCMHAKSLQLCPALSNTMDCSRPGSSVHEILQARILEWVAMPPPRVLPNCGIEYTTVSSNSLKGDSLPLKPHFTGMCT